LVFGVTSYENYKQNEDAESLVGLMSGGNSFAYFMLYQFDMTKNTAGSAALIRKGKFPLYDVGMRIMDADSQRIIVDRNFGELSGGGDSAGALVWPLSWPLADRVNYGISFSARNGMWTQVLKLRKSQKADCWLAATRVYGKHGQVIFEHDDNEFVGEFGDPWAGDTQHDEQRH
jgi:hypothetical protein